MGRKPKEPGGCCLVQMIFVLALTIQRATKRCFAADYGLDEDEQLFARRPALVAAYA